jgi:hypothetical protein
MPHQNVHQFQAFDNKSVDVIFWNKIIFWRKMLIKFSE